MMLGAAAVCELEHSQIKQISDGLLWPDPSLNPGREALQRLQEGAAQAVLRGATT
jgi:hypothetical protein